MSFLTLAKNVIKILLLTKHPESLKIILQRGNLKKIVFIDRKYL